MTGTSLPHSVAATQPRIPANVVPESGALFGAYVNHSGDGSPSALKAELLAREAALGRTLDYHTMFFGFRQPLASQLVAWDVQSGRIPLISWAGADTQLIVAGSYDDIIRSQAIALRDLGGPIIVRWGWEGEGLRNRSWAHSGPLYVDAWRHIVTIFRAEGATNVMFAWVGIAVSFTNGVAAPFYPGDDWVDWIGVDGYNWSPGRSGFPWISFEQIFSAFYAWAEPKEAPLMIAEFGVQERYPGEKAAWFAAAGDVLMTRFPDVKAISYFDTLGRYDWRIDTSTSSFDAFRAFSTNPYFNP